MRHAVIYEAHPFFVIIDFYPSEKGIVIIAASVRPSSVRAVVIPAVRVPSVNSPIFIGVSGIIVGISRGKIFCLAQN